jgi:chromosome segregation ATPase
MKDQLKNRLEGLKAEYASGQRALADLQARETELRETLARIKDAIGILEEEIGKEGSGDRLNPAPNRTPIRKIGP